MKTFFLAILRFFKRFFLALFGLFSHSRKKTVVHHGLHKNDDPLGIKIKNIFNRPEISDSLFDELEETLVTGDVGIETTLKLIQELKTQVKVLKLKSIQEVKNEFKSLMIKLIPEETINYNEDKLHVLFILGVNGVGKTTSIAKLANLIKLKNKKIMIAAGDTFRAAAIEQLCEWGQRINVPVLRQQANSDPGAVLYDALDSALAKKLDYLIVDTAGRLHNRTNLMKEIEELDRIIEKKGGDKIIKENILVLDATTGQNAFNQAEAFHQAIGIQGIFLAKLDSTSKGGILITLAQKLGIPVKFIGLGEKINDIQEFNREQYIISLLE